MANDERIVLRRTDGSGAGVLFRTQAEADEFMSANDGYKQESLENGAVDPVDNIVQQRAAELPVAERADAAREGYKAQAEARAQARTKAVTADEVEDKAVAKKAKG